MSQSPKEGNTVKVHYVGTLSNGTVFDSSRKRDEPLHFKIGAGLVIPGFEEAVLGMKVGETKKITIPAKDAYGDHMPALVQSIDRSHLPQDLDPKEGMQLQIGESEEVTIVTITHVDDKNVTLDANHPLAGEALTFELELVEVI